MRVALFVNIVVTGHRVRLGTFAIWAMKNSSVCWAAAGRLARSVATASETAGGTPACTSQVFILGMRANPFLRQFLGACQGLSSVHVMSCTENQRAHEVIGWQLAAHHCLEGARGQLLATA